MPALGVQRTATVRFRMAIAVLVLLLCAQVGAQNPTTSLPAATRAGQVSDDRVFTPSEPGRDLKAGKTLHASRLPAGTAPVIDGVLSDEVWTLAEPAAGFLQRDPDNGKPMTEETRVQVAYDDRYVYIAVVCVDGDAAAIAGGLGRRDEVPSTDYVTVAFDPRHDHQTGYAFQTNPSGWQGDFSYFNDDGNDRDYNVNWEVRTRQTGSGWTAEFRIPFSQMRFPAVATPGQVWGFNAQREIRRKKESGTWVARPRGETGDVSLFGHLVFDAPIGPPGRFELTPYALARAEREPGGALGGAATAGGDVRVGIGPGATLAATVNPDFGQVEQDPAVLNLSIFETFFPEKRSFFLEDSRTFVPPYGLFQLFHSRRIGRTPDRFSVLSSDRVLDRPDDTTIVGAAKLTGKSSGWTYGALSALTATEHARVEAPRLGADGATRVFQESRLIEPLSSYNVGRVQRDVLGSSNIGALVTGVMRDRGPDAFTGGIDYSLRWDRNRTVWNGHWAVTHAPGNNGTKSGGGGVTNFDVSRKHWGVNAHADHFGENFRVGDLGFMRARVNRTLVEVNGEMKQPDPWTVFRDMSMNGFAGRAWNDERLVFAKYTGFNVGVEFRNYWGIGAGGNHNEAVLDDLDTRGGPPIVQPANSFAYVRLSSDSRKAWRATAGTDGRVTDAGGRNRNVFVEFSWQPLDRLQLSTSSNYEHGVDAAQWIRNEDVDGDGVTDYVYGSLRRHVIDITLRSTYAFSRDLTLQAYMQPFVAVGRYENIRKLARPRSYEFQPVAIAGSPDFNDKSVHGNVVLRWEYLRGSTFFVVWNLTRADDTRPGVFSARRDLGGAFSGAATNIFLVKLSYWVNR